MQRLTAENDVELQWSFNGTISDQQNIMKTFVEAQMENESAEWTVSKSFDRINRRTLIKDLSQSDR